MHAQCGPVRQLHIDIVHENMYDAQNRKLICHNGMWKRIDDIMKLSGYTFTPEQLRGRWKTLVSSYKRVKDNNKPLRKHECSADLAFLDKSVDVVPTVVVQSSQDTFPARKIISQNETMSQMPTIKEKTMRQTVTQHLQDISSSFWHQQQLDREQEERHHVENLTMMERLLLVTELKNKTWTQTTG